MTTMTRDPTIARSGEVAELEADRFIETARPLPLNWNLVKTLLAFWALAILINVATNRALREELAIALWGGSNLVLLLAGTTFYEVFLLLMVPCILVGFVDYFGLAGIRVDVYYLLPALNLIPYCLAGLTRKNFPERNFVARQFPLLPFVALFDLALVLSTMQGHVTYKTEALRMIGLIFIIPIFFYVFAVHALSRLANIKQVAVVIVLFSSYYAASLGALQMTWRSGFAKVVRNLVLYPEIFLIEMWEKTYKEAKISSIFPDSASFGHVLNFAFPLAIGLYLLAKRPFEKLLYFGAIGLIGAGTLITGNRTDLLGLMLSVGLISISFGLRSAGVRKLFFQFFLIASVCVIAMMTVRENNSFRRLFMPNEWDTHTGTGRIVLIEEGLRMFREHPFLGVGPDHYYHNQFYRNPITGRVEVEQRPHNLLIQILSESGLLGTSMFLLLMFAVFRLAPTSWRHRTRTEVDFLCFLFLISCVTLLAQGAIENSLFYFQTSCLFWLGVGIWRGRAGENTLNVVPPD